MAVYEEIPAPGFNLGDTYQDDELLHSDNGGFTQEGLTLPKGTASIPMGTVMAAGSDNLYYPRDGSVPPPSGVTLGPAEGVIRHGAQLHPDRVQLQNIVTAGILKLEKVHGYDNTSLAELGAIVSVRRGTFKF